MKFWLSLIITCVFLSGCGANNPTLNRLVNGKKEVSIEIKKSNDETEHYTIPVHGQNLNDVMLATEVPFTTQMHGQDLAMITLAGIISTEGKEWRLYINDQPRIGADISKINLNESTKISWRYETK